MNIRFDWQNVMNENEVTYIENKEFPDYSYRLTKPLTLVSGVTLSIQASHPHYCTPRKTISDYNQYTHFEIGFPSVEIKELLEFAENMENPTGTVYGYVPKSIIDKYCIVTGKQIGRAHV